MLQAYGAGRVRPAEPEALLNKTEKTESNNKNRKKIPKPQKTTRKLKKQMPLGKWQFCPPENAEWLVCPEH